MGSIKELESNKYTEYINLKNGLKILQNWQSILSNFPETRQLKIKNSEFDPLINLKKMLKDKQEIVHTTYKFSKHLQTYGRLFAQNSSLQGLPREIRNALAQGIYHDIDMKNAHPVLLSQYCNKNGIKCNIIEEYVKNRDEVLEQVSLENKVDKGTAKQAFLSLLNGGSGNKLQGEFINKFKQEILLIHKQIALLNPEEFKKVKARKDYNPEGTMINILLCKLEHMVLMNSVMFFKSLNYNVDVLVFDGFMVRQEENKPITEELLKNLQIYIKDKTSYDIVFVEKSLENEIDLSQYIEPLLDEKASVTYYRDKEEFEKTHLKIKHPALYITILDDGNYDYQSEEKIVSSYKHLSTTILDDKGKSVKVSFIKTWITDENIRVYDKMVFVPPPANYNSFKDYNTWTDFVQENMKLPDDFDLDTNPHIIKFNEFIYNLFDGVEEYMEYFKAWSANIIQNPANRSCVCLVLYSLFEGVGKNMIIKTLENCIGENYTYYISDVGNQLFGKHACAELNRLLLVLNEVKGKDTYANTDLFKTRITDTKREVELKGKDAFQIKNYCSYILNSNNPCVVNASDKDRRFCVLPCVNKKMEDKLYFDEYERTVNDNPEAIRCIYEYLKRFDVEKVVPNKLFATARPISKLYAELQLCNREKEWDFLESIVIENNDTPNATVIINNEMLWSKFKLYCNNNNFDITKLSSKRFLYLFSQQVVNYLDNKPEYYQSITKGRTSTSRYYEFNIQKLKKFFNIEDENNE